MDESTYGIFPDWKDVLVYDEGDGRALRLDCDFVDPLYQVSVPTADRWVAQTPPWAHERRIIILARLRAANCLICDVDQSVRSINYPQCWPPRPQVAPATPHARPAPGSTRGPIVQLMLCLMFVAAGIWQSIEGLRPRDHWLGALCALFFAACAAAPISDLRRWFRRQRKM